ncbi:MAG: VanZ family protein [Rhodospirillales bacterium]|nr:VanZ family protein [Rhodospirillales bacterium]
MTPPAHRPAPLAMLAFSARGAFVVGALAVIVISLAPVKTLPTFELSDKVNHAIAYAFLAATGCFGFGAFSSRAQLVIVVSLSLFGGLIEVLQPLSGRSASVADTLANQIGIALGWLVARKAASLLRRPR